MTGVMRRTLAGVADACEDARPMHATRAQADVLTSARMAAGMKDCPVDAAIVGIIDTVDVVAG